MKRPLSTSSSSADPWRLLLRVLLFLAPLLLSWGGLEWILWRTGESWTVAKVHRWQDTQGGLFGRQLLSQQFNLYKMAGIVRRRPDVLVLGSSRMMQIRGLMFGKNVSFYNAGGLLQQLADLEAVAGLLREGRLPKPRVALVGIDPWWLKPQQEGEPSWLLGDVSDAATSLAARGRVVRELLRHPRRLLEALTLAIEFPAGGGRGYAGLAAGFSGGGFRPDGSRLYYREVSEYEQTGAYRDRESPRVIDRVRAQSRQFAPPLTVDKTRLHRCIAALTTIGDLGMEVIAMSPPFSDEVVAALNSDEASRQWWAIVSTHVPDSLRAAGFSTIALQRPADDGFDDRYMLDGFHPGEVLMAHVVARMLQTASPKSFFARLEPPAQTPHSELSLLRPDRRLPFAGLAAGRSASP